MKDLNKTYLMKIINNNSWRMNQSIYHQAHVVDDSAYITDGYRAVKFPAALINIEPAFICQFTALKKDNKEKNKVNALVDLFNKRINTSEFQEYIIDIPRFSRLFKEIKRTNFGKENNLPSYHVGESSILIKVENTYINAEYLLDVLKICKDKYAKILVNTKHKLDTVYYINESYNITGLICPIRYSDNVKAVIVDVLEIVSYL